MTLAVHDEVGVWASDVIYVHDKEFNLYWMSDPDVRHSKVIRSNKKIAGTITACWDSNNKMEIQFIGSASKIEGDRNDLAHCSTQSTESMSYWQMRTV
jgi:uncharacterized protein YhbP (UPF0306 family)